MVWVLFSCKARKEAAKPTPDTTNRNQVALDYAYVNGCTERMKGNLQEALKIFEECKKISPTNAAVHYELGTIYKLLGNNNQAIANAKFCAEAEPSNEWYQLLLIDCYNVQKQYAQSVKVREALVKRFPEKVEFKEDLAIEYIFLGQYDKSLKIYDDLEKIYGVNEQLTLNKVKILKGLKKNKEAEAELIRLSDANKNESRYYSYLADFYIELNDQEKAKAMYDKILVLDPDNTTVNLELHDYYSAKGNDAEAFTYLKKAFRNPGLEVSVKASITNSFYERAKQRPEDIFKEQGMELAKIMLEVHPNEPESNALYADFLMLDKKSKEASGYYYLAAINEHRNSNIWFNLLSIDNELVRYDSLEHHSKLALELFPSQPLFYFYNGFANNQQRNYGKAVQSYKDGLEFVVDDKSLLLRFYSNLGDAYYNVKDYPKSDKAFDDALKIDADNTYVLNNYAYYLSIRNENLEKAEKFSKRTNDIQPNNRNYMDTYGWILFQEKKYKEAEEWLANASKLGPKNPTILEHYGDVLYKLNKPAEAVSQWEAAKQAGGSSENLLKKIKDKKTND